MNFNKTDEFFSEANQLISNYNNLNYLLNKLHDTESCFYSPGPEAKIQEFQQMILEKIETIRLKSFSKAFCSGFCMTSEDLAIILDSTHDFITRHLKNHIEHIIVPFPVADFFFDFNNFNVLEQVNLSRKAIFFNKARFADFLKNNLYEVSSKVELKVDFSTILEKYDNIRIEDIASIAKKFLSSFARKYEYQTPASEEIIKDILDRNIDLVKASTITPLVYKKSLKSQAALADSLLTSALTSEELSEEDYENQSKLFNDYFRKNSSDFIYSLKNSALVHQAQVYRFIDNQPHIKFHLLLPEAKKPTSLYCFTDLESIYEISRANNSINGNGILSFAVTESLLPTDINAFKATILTFVDEMLSKTTLNTSCPII